MSRLRAWILGGAVLVAARLSGRRRREDDEDERIVAPAEPDPRGERLVLVLLGLAALCALSVPVVYGVEAIPDRTQYLGLGFGMAFLLAGAALIAAGARLVPQEEIEEPYPPPEHAQEQERVARTIEEGGVRIRRRRLLGLTVAGAAGAFVVALLTPLAGLGPVFSTEPLTRTPWRRGRRLVDERGRPVLAADIAEGTFYTAFPEGADREQMGAPLVLVRLRPEDLRLPDALRGYDAGGILAFSKICTHAACAISLYRVPLFGPAEPSPALICPCHYSTFDPATGGTVLFGPAGRPLPMLPLEVDAAGALRAAGGFGGRIGPSWWGVRMGRPA